MQGEPLSGGIAIGRAFIILPDEEPDYKAVSQADIPEEINRFKTGIKKAAAGIKSLIDKVRNEMGDEKAEIFEGHLEILTSEDFEEETISIIREKMVSAEEAVKLYTEENAREMESLEDEYFRERGQDFRDIGKQVINGIKGTTGHQDNPESEAIIVARELTPSQTARLDIKKVAGFVIQKGGKNSHAAIIARSLEVPAIILSDPDPCKLIKPGDTLSINGDNGDFEINPSPAKIKNLEKLIERKTKEKSELEKLLDLPAVTTDGVKIGLFANVGGNFDIESAARYRVDGIGLFRTEFLFMESAGLPSAGKQADAYKKAVESMTGKEVIIRLLDTGADKPLPYWKLPIEENPFLGVRGIRLLLQKEEILRTQIQALLQASASGPVGIMIPMVGSLKSIEKVRAIVEEEKKAVLWNNRLLLKLGVMIETPAAVQLIEEILEIVDFVSIGTNDLTQYILAADRGNPQMGEYYDEFHPAVIRSIAHIIKKARKKGKMNGICGEFAGNKLALPLFIGLKVEELSMTPSAVPGIKKMIRSIDSRDAENLVNEILRIPTTEGIKSRLSQFLTERDLLK